jgi:hypothetical protein
MRALNAGPAGNGQRLRLIAHLGFAFIRHEPRKNNREKSTNVARLFTR